MKLAVFDLDGTITRRDTLLPYLTGYLARAPWRLPRLLFALPTLLLFLVGLAGHGRLKSAFIRAASGGCTRSRLDAWTAEFVPRVLAEGVFADALSKVASHKRVGDRLVLMSASTDLYVPTFAEALGFNEVICTGLRWNGDRLDGRLSTPNRRGEEKARCFMRLRNEHPGLSTAAYGNAGSDLAHLRLADEPLLVNGSWRARRAAVRLGIPYTQWS